jgi:hypothetical protein
MDHNATLEYPLQAPFHYLSSAGHLRDRLPQVAGVEEGTGQLGVDHPVGLSLAEDGHEVPASGELTAYEPPSSVAYGLVVGTRTHVLRVTCTSAGEATKVHVYQPDGPVRLAVDLIRLGRDVATEGTHPFGDRAAA